MALQDIYDQFVVCMYCYTMFPIFYMLLKSPTFLFLIGSNLFENWSAVSNHILARYLFVKSTKSTANEELLVYIAVGFLG